MNLPPDPEEKCLEWQTASFVANWTIGCICETKKSNDQTNFVIVGENRPLGVPMGPKYPIIALE